MYYPYARCYSPVALKQAILLFEELLFNDPLDDEYRRKIMLHVDDNDSDVPFGWKGIEDDYAFLVESGVARFLDIRIDGPSYRAMVSDSTDPKYLSKLLTLIKRDMWKIYRSRVDDGTFIDAVNEFIANGARYASEHSELRNEEISRLTSFVVSDWRAMGHHGVPAVCGYALNVNEALRISDLEGVGLFTDDVAAAELIRYKYETVSDFVSRSASAIAVPGLSETKKSIKRSLVGSFALGSFVSEADLGSLTISDCLAFRKRHGEEYVRFWRYIDSAAAEIDEALDSQNFAGALDTLVRTKINPELQTLRDGLRKSYENAFGNLATKLASSLTPTLIGSLLAGISSGQMLTLGIAAAAGAVSWGAPEFVDLWSAKRERERSGLHYLLNIDAVSGALARRTRQT